LLVAVILIATVIITYSAIRSSPVSDMPQVLSAIDETNFALKQVLGFTIGYYGSVLKVTGNVTYARILAENYLYSGLINIANMHPDWGASFKVDTISLQARWFEKISYSMGDLAVSYNLTGLGIYGISYGITCKLNVNVTNTVDNKAYLNITKDENEPLINLGKNNFRFYKYDYDSLTWELVNPTEEPEVTSNGMYSINLPYGVDSDSFMVQVEDQRGIIVTAASFTRYAYTLAWNPNITLISGESFEGNWPPSGWTATGSWGKKNAAAYDGAFSAGVDGQGGGASGDLTTFDLNCTDASSIYVEFWYRDDGCESGEFLLQYYNGNTWINVADLGNTTLENQWLYYQQKVTDNQFFKSNFKIRWSAVGVDNNEHAYIDYVTVKKEMSLLTPNEPIVVELLQNGTMRWLGQNLQLTTQAKPIPPIPVKSVRVNQTINGINREVPFQVEDWASDYKVPLGLASNMSVFGNRHMLVFLVNRNVSKVTLWWDGSDTATQTPYAYVNRYFNDQPPTGSSDIGTLRNGRLTLTIDASGSSFLVKSRITTTGIEVTARFMRANNEWSIYGSNPAYAIYNGIVRDIVHAEAEWEDNPPGDYGGIPNCANVYSHIVIILPANTTYYTYQLRLIFLNSTDKPRTIIDLCPIRISTTAGGTFSALTENGTLGFYPRVSTSSTLFYNMSNIWQHHWSQLSSSITRGFGIMFPNDSNVKLYHFDSMASDKTGCLSVSSSSKFIEFLPVKRSQVSNFASSLDVCWYGAVVTFDGTTPIYKLEGGAPTGLWILVEYPPVITVTAEG
jgi:hypothetical protein